MRKKHSLLLLAALALVGLTVVGCGGSSSDNSTSSVSSDTTASNPTTTAAEKDSSGGKTVAVNIKDIKFSPKTQNVKVGETIKWTNQDPVGHDVTATSGGTFKSDTLNTGDTFEFKATKAGTIQYVCTIHPGQSGTIVVS